VATQAASAQSSEQIRAVWQVSFGAEASPFDPPPEHPSESSSVNDSSSRMSV
jgi:hypothetical protein